MTYVIAQPQIMAAAAADIERIGSALNAAKGAAAGPTSVLLAPAADEVSAAVTKLFGAYGQQYQAVLQRAAGFHNEFTQALAAAGHAYLNTEGAMAAAMGATMPHVVSAVTPINSDLTLILGGTGNPTPGPDYVTNANDLFIRATNLATVKPLFTPEEGYPLTGVKSLTFDKSISVGLDVLDNVIMQQVPPSSTNTLTVFGYSQSAIIASLEMQKLASLGPAAPHADQLNFVLVGNEMNPNGGLLARFPGLSIPSLGLTFYGATPSDTIYPTNIYTLEYDGFADFPRYPINLLSDLNAITGIVAVHPTYLNLDPTQVDNAILLGTSPNYYADGGVTHYYMIPTENLPLLNGLRGIPVIGTPLADLIQPDMRVLVNLGYGDPDFGWSTAPADVPTPFGLFPHVPLSTIANDLAVGAQQGFADFKADLATIPGTPITYRVEPPPLVTALMGPAPGQLAPTPQNIVNTVAKIVSTDYAVLLPTADIGLALITSIPAYDATLFVDQLLAGNLINAIGYPIAADIGLATVAGMTEFISIAEAVVSNIQDIRSLLP